MVYIFIRNNFTIFRFTDISEHRDGENLFDIFPESFEIFLFHRLKLYVHTPIF